MSSVPTTGWIAYNRSADMASVEPSGAAARLAHGTDAAAIYVKWNFGHDMCVLAISTVWEALQNEGRPPKRKLMPLIAAIHAKQGKLLRGKPVMQRMVEDRVRPRGMTTDLEDEWGTWMQTDPTPQVGSTPPVSSSTA